VGRNGNCSRCSARAIPGWRLETYSRLQQLWTGARLELLDAIATLGPRIHGSAAQVKSPPIPPASSATSAVVAGERRHVTVMFCDLVDSTGISAKLDPEEWRDLVGAYLDAASTAVTEMGGKVAKKLGDGLMAAVRPSVGAGKRCRARCAGGALDPAGAGRAEP
jgi:class 3 adenylate cyclase